MAPLVRKRWHAIATGWLVVVFAASPRADVRVDQLQRLKLLQQRILLSEPAERLEQRERIDAWREHQRRTAPTRRAGARAKPFVPWTDARILAPSRGVGPYRSGSLSRILSPTNVRVNDPTGEPSGTCQSEVSLAAQGSRIVATWNDGEGYVTLPASDTQGFGYSTDGGLTWTDGGSIPNDGTFLWSSDPVVVVDDKTGDFYYSALIDRSGSNGLAVTRGSFSGSTFSWGTPVVALSLPNSTNLIDKEWLAADSLNGNLYISYSNFVMVGGQAVSNSIQFIRSIDHGQTWSAPITLSDSRDAGLVQGSQTAVGPEGEVYAVWYAIGQASGPNANSPYGRDFLRIRKSVDDGLSFAPSVTADSLFSNFGSGAPGFNRGYGITFPGIAVDRSVGRRRGRVYLTWNESLNFYNDPFPIPGMDPARSEVEPDNGALQATPFVPGDILRGRIATTGSPGDFDYWKWDAIQGQTGIFYLDSLASILDASFRVFCSDGTTLLGFSQNGSGGGEVLVFTAPTTATYYLRVASYTGTNTGGYRILTTLNTPQNDRARDQRDIFVKASGNGVYWAATQRVNDDPPYFDDWLPGIAVDRWGRALVAHYDFRDEIGICGGGSNVYVTRSEDGGDTWAAESRVSDTSTNWTTTISTLIPNQGDYLGLHPTADDLLVAWADGRNGDPDVYAATLTLPAPVGVAASSPPDRIPLSAATPNPFRDRTSFVVTLPGPGRAQVAVYDIGGRLVRRLVDQTLSPGNHTFWWDGRDQSAKRVASGIYLVRLSRPGWPASMVRVCALR